MRAQPVADHLFPSADGSLGIPTKPAGGTDPEAGRCSDVKPATIPI
jgi:hypothetical protein